MNRFRSKLSWWRRRLFGSYRITDPRPLAEAAPYTFFLPSENEVLALKVGDLAKLIFQSVPASNDYAAERMWVVITHVDGDQLTGRLDNVPLDMPQLRRGSEVRFRRGDVIDLRWVGAHAVRPPSAPVRRHYEERCLVDSCVVREKLEVHYLYREDSLPEDEAGEPDSGWRIRGDFRGLADEAAIDARATEWVTIGQVLNADDSWLHLVDAPVGSAYVRNWQSNRFEPESAAAD